MRYLLSSIFFVLLMKPSISAETYDFHKLDVNNSTIQKSDFCFNCHISKTDMDSSDWLTPKNYIDGEINNYYDSLGTPDSFSKTCLLCHDGNDVSLAAHIPLSPCGLKTNDTGRGHPIFVTFSDKNGLHDPSEPLGDVWRDGKIVGDLLRDDKVVCVSCHTAHNSKGDGYLRTYNTSSMLCLGCHNK